MARVLLADSDADTRTILRCALLYENFEVIEAPDADAAHRLARSCPVDLIVLNYPMRLRTGVTLTQALRDVDRLRHLPIINFTSHVTRKTIIDACRDGVTRTLAKPAHVDTVLAMIRGLIEPRAGDF